MTQKDGMPMRFQAYVESENQIFEVLNINCRDKTVSIKMLNKGELSSVPLLSFKYRSVKYLFEEIILLQAIGAFSSDDPPQELCFGDLIEFECPDEIKITGLIVWRSFCVEVKIKSGAKTGYKFTYLPFDYMGDCEVKKLGSRYTKEGQEILSKILSEGEGKKAGLEES